MVSLRQSPALLTMSVRVLSQSRASRASVPSSSLVPGDNSLLSDALHGTGRDWKDHVRAGLTRAGQNQQIQFEGENEMKNIQRTGIRGFPSTTHGVAHTVLHSVLKSCTPVHFSICCGWCCDVALTTPHPELREIQRMDVPMKCLEIFCCIL